MFLILEQLPNWFSLGLRQGMARAGRDVLVLTPENIVSRLQITYLIKNSEISMKMSIDDLTFFTDDVVGVYSGIDSFPPSLWPYFSEKDAAYASMEYQALWLSILSSLSVPVVNPPGTDAIGGALLSKIELYDLARKAGLHIPAIFEVESGREAANLADKRNLSFINRGEKIYAERYVNRQALLSEPVCNNQVSIREYLPGRSVSVIMVNHKAFPARASIEQGTWFAMKSSDIPAGFLSRLDDLHSKTDLKVAEYLFSVSRENQWSLSGMKRLLTDETPAVHKDRVISEIISLVATAGTSQ